MLEFIYVGTGTYIGQDGKPVTIMKVGHTTDCTYDRLYQYQQENRRRSNPEHEKHH
jgi:hypothetical protein